MSDLGAISSVNIEPATSGGAAGIGSGGGGHRGHGASPASAGSAATSTTSIKVSASSAKSIEPDAAESFESLLGAQLGNGRSSSRQQAAFSEESLDGEESENAKGGEPGGSKKSPAASATPAKANSQNSDGAAATLHALVSSGALASASSLARASSSSSPRQSYPQPKTSAPLRGVKTPASRDSSATDSVARAASDRAAASAKKVSQVALKPAGEVAASSAEKSSASAPGAAGVTSTSSGSAHPLEAPSARTSAPAPAAVPFARDADADPSLHVSVLPQAAHLRMDVEGSGDLALHLRLRDGVAHVTVAGSAAPAVEARSSDLRSALASQGLSLARIEVVTPSAESQSGGATGQELAQDRSRGGSNADDRDDNRRSSSGASASSAAGSDSAAFTISRSAPSSGKSRQSGEEQS